MSVRQSGPCAARRVAMPRDTLASGLACARRTCNRESALMYRHRVCARRDFRTIQWLGAAVHSDTRRSARGRTRGRVGSENKGSVGDPLFCVFEHLTAFPAVLVLLE